MKIFKILAVALVAMLGFTACNKECGHEIIEHDHSKDLAGTWTCFTENYAEVLVINADGSAVSYGVEDGEYWENVRGTVVTKDGKITMTFEDDDNFTGHFDIIPGQAFSLYEDSGERYVYQYCANDLSDEIIGMWVCNGGVLGQKGDINIQTFNTDGKAIFTGGLTTDENEPFLNIVSTYKVIGDLAFQKMAGDLVPDKYQVFQMTYAPDGTSAGDIMVQKMYLTTEKGTREETVSSWLRIKQHLELPDMKYDYIKTFVSNVKGVDKDIDVMGYKFNFAKMDGVMLDKMLKTLLFTVEFPDANTIKYSCLYDRNAEPAVVEAPIAVDGNKMTIKISEEYPGLKDIDMYTFQDQDNTQMHMYMPTYSFINFFGNMQVIMMSQLDMIDTTDAAAVKAIYDSIDDAVETINLSLVMTKATKAL